MEGRQLWSMTAIEDGFDAKPWTPPGEGKTEG
jgi:hypothetical protein